MRVDIIETYTEFEKLKSNWEAVYEADSEAQFFLSWNWLSQVFSQHRKGWFIIAVKPGNTNSNYVAFFPLRLKTRMSRTLHELYNDISVAGRFFWADYSGFICHPDYDDEAIPHFSSQLKQMHWRNIYLKNLLISDSRLDLFLSQFDKNIFSRNYLERTSKTDNVNQLVCPYVDLPDDFETYLKEKLSSNTRQKIRRFMRKVENSNDLRIIHSVPETHERDLNILVSFWKRKWEKRKGREVEYLATKYREILQQGLENNTVYIPVLWQGDKPICALGSFIDRQKRTLLYFVSGRDESYNNPPPGLVLHAHSIRWAIENGLKTYDFLRGDEHFKYSLGATDRKIRYLLLSTRTGTNHNRTLDPTCIGGVLKQAARYEKSGRIKEAALCFYQILETDPEDLTALHRYGRLLYQNEQFKKSRKIYLKLLEIDQDNIEGWRGLGKSLLALNKFKAAESAIRKAIELNPDDTISARFYLARALQGQHMDTAATDEYSALINLKPRDKWEIKKQQRAQRYLKAL